MTAPTVPLLRAERTTAPAPVLTPAQGVSVIAASATGVLLLWQALVGTAAGQRADTAVMQAFADVPTAVTTWTSALLDSVTATNVALLLVALTVVAVLRRDVRAEIAAASVLLGANVTTQVLKSALTRPELGEGTANSLPSGHVTLLASLAVAAAIVVPGRVRAAVAALGALVTGVGALAVLVWQWHRPSDVLAALLVVAAWWAGTAVLALRRG